MAVTVPRWAVAANAGGPFSALIIAVLINCATAASILLSLKLN